MDEISENNISSQFLLYQNVDKPLHQRNSLDHVIQMSKKFPIEFPVSTVKCEALYNDIGVSDDILEYCIDFAYPILYEPVVFLYLHFLEYKRKFGSPEEIVIYRNMDLIDLVQRLLEKRAVYFFNSKDCYKLLDGMTGEGKWEGLGESRPYSLRLNKCLSYDEIKLSAFLSVSSYSVFINNGKRYNNGIATTRVADIEPFGLVVNLVGARFEKPGFMDWQEIIVSRDQNTEKNGYGSEAIQNGASNWRQFWAYFYKLKTNFPMFNEVSSSDRFLRLQSGDYFDNLVYEKRLQISFETLLIEAQHRAKKVRKKAYIHVVGIGLGVWKISDHQEQIFLDAFASSIRKLLPKLNSVSDVNFAWFKKSSCGGVYTDNFLTVDGTNNKVRVRFSKRNPHDRLPDEDANKLLVVSYPGDGNALPGNEFWSGVLSSSGNASEAASSQIAEIHNPYINSKVCGHNLHVATSEWGVVHISTYAKYILDNILS